MKLTVKLKCRGRLGLTWMRTRMQSMEGKGVRKSTQRGMLRKINFEKVILKEEVRTEQISSGRVVHGE